MESNKGLVKLLINEKRRNTRALIKIEQLIEDKKELQVSIEEIQQKYVECLSKLKVLQEEFIETKANSYTIEEERYHQSQYICELEENIRELRDYSERILEKNRYLRKCKKYLDRHGESAPEFDDEDYIYRRGVTDEIHISSSSSDDT